MTRVRGRSGIGRSLLLRVVFAVFCLCASGATSSCRAQPYEITAEQARAVADRAMREAEVLTPDESVTVERHDDPENGCPIKRIFNPDPAWADYVRHVDDQVRGKRYYLVIYELPEKDPSVMLRPYEGFCVFIDRESGKLIFKIAPF